MVGRDGCAEGVWTSKLSGTPGWKNKDAPQKIRGLNETDGMD